MKTTVIYHSADFDGKFCAAIARKFLPEDTEFIGWDFADKPLPFPEAGTHYIVMDLPMDRPFGMVFERGWLCWNQPDKSWEERQIQPIDRIDFSHWLWIDHHKSAIDSHPLQIPGYRIDGVSACRLAWQYWTGAPEAPLPGKEWFIDRTISEPWAVRLAGEYDIFDKRDPDAELFQHGLRSRILSDADWRCMLQLNGKLSVDELERLAETGASGLLNPDGTSPNPVVYGLLQNGRVLQFAKAHENESIITKLGFTIQFEGLTVLACNHAMFNSHLFAAGLKPEHEALLGFKFDGSQWSVSLYHAPGKEHHDLSAIAKRYGGGGHKGACGFRVKTLSFMNSNCKQ